MNLSIIFQKSRFDLDFWEWILEIEWYRYWNCTYIVMIAMILTAFNSGNYYCCVNFYWSNFKIIIYDN